MPLLALVAGILLIFVGFFVGFPVNIICWIVGGLILLYAFGVVGGGPRPGAGRRWW